MRYLLTPVRMALSNRQEINRVDKGVENREPWGTDVRSYWRDKGRRLWEARYMRSSSHRSLASTSVFLEVLPKPLFSAPLCPLPGCSHPCQPQPPVCQWLPDLFLQPNLSQRVCLHTQLPSDLDVTSPLKVSVSKQNSSPFSSTWAPPMIPSWQTAALSTVTYWNLAVSLGIK